jgi:hypothetical protein
MRVLVVLALLAACASCASITWPSSFFVTRNWGSLDCSGTASIEEYFPFDSCATVNYNPAQSTQYTRNSAGLVTERQYSDKFCTAANPRVSTTQQLAQ